MALLGTEEMIRLRIGRRSSHDSGRNKTSGFKKSDGISGDKCVVCGNATTMEGHVMQFDKLQCSFWYHYKCANKVRGQLPFLETMADRRWYDQTGESESGFVGRSR